MSRDDRAAAHSRHAAVGGTAHRFQRRVSFETLSPEKLRQQVASFSARYLVVIDAHWGDGFGWQQLSADPACRLKVVYRERDVAILEVEPNRTGRVSRTAHDDWLQEQLSKLDEFLKQHPDRDDVVVRRTSLLRELGRNDEAIASLRGLIDKGHTSVRVCADLGWALFDERRYAEAAQYLDLARGLPQCGSDRRHAGRWCGAGARTTARNAGRDRLQVGRSLAKSHPVARHFVEMDQCRT